MKRLVIINLILILSIYIIPKEPQKHINTTINKVATTSRSSEAREIPLEQTKIENKPINISEEGINLIKKYEGLKLHSYRLEGEKYFTIGYRS